MKSNQNLVKLILITILIVVAGYFIFKSSKTTQSTEETSNRETTETAESIEKLDPTINIEEYIKEHFDQMITDEGVTPEVIDGELKNLAQKLNLNQIEQLKNIALDAGKSNDTRYFSIELLGKNSTSEAQSALANIIQEPLYPHEDARLTLEEEMIRGRSAELVKDNELLESVKVKVENTFVLDRIQRQQLYLQGKAPSPEEQDDQSLKELFNRESK